MYAPGAAGAPETRVTPPRRATPRTGRAFFVALIAGVALACGRSSPSAPRTEFIVAAGDSSYWIRSDASGIRMRGSPLVLARLDGRFLELYVVDDDRSYEDAVFVGQRLYERDIVSGDSIEIFHDTIVPTLADRYARRHPDAQPLGPDDEPKENPAITATAEVSVLGVHGPFLSIEYHVDTVGQGEETWHMTRHVVIDLRSGVTSKLADVLGDTEAKTVLLRARNLYRETLDSLRSDRRPEARRALQAIGHFHFDPSSFSLTAPSGTLMVAFSAPGQGTGGEGFVLPLRPIPVGEPGWWRDARVALPTISREREEQWTRGSYSVRAAYDTAALPVRLTLLDSAGREFAVGGIAAPVHRIYWLDTPPLEGTVRSALTRAFDEAGAYDEDTRAAQLGRPATLRVASAK